MYPEGGLFSLYRMNRTWRRHTAVLLLFAYVASGFILEVVHHDHLGLVLHPHPVLSTHDCGAIDDHPSLDGIHPCPICLQAAQRISTPATSYMPAGDRMLCIIRVPGSPISSWSTGDLHPRKRGPPTIPL